MESGGNASIGGGNDNRYFQYELLQPSEVVIIDDANSYQLFGDRIFCAPQDDAIEGTQLKFEFHALLIVIRTVFLPGLSKPEFSYQGRLQHVP